MNPNTDKLVRRTTMGVTCVAAYFLFTADYGSPNALDPIKNAILSTQQAAKSLSLERRKRMKKVRRGSLAQTHPRTIHNFPNRRILLRYCLM